MSATNEKDRVVLHTAHGEMTAEEFDALGDRILEAQDRGDTEEAMRLAKLVPLDPDLGMTLKLFFGKDEVLEGGWDLTEANLKFGEGWLDE